MNDYLTVSNLRLAVQLALPAILSGLTILRTQKAEHQHRKFSYFIPHVVYAFVWMILMSALHNSVSVYRDLIEGTRVASICDWVFIICAYLILPAFISWVYAKYEMKQGRGVQDDGWILLFQKNESQYVIIRTKTGNEFYGFMSTGSTYSPGSNTIFISESWHRSGDNLVKRGNTGGFIFDCTEIQTLEFIKRTEENSNVE